MVKDEHESRLRVAKHKQVVVTIATAKVILTTVVVKYHLKMFMAIALKVIMALHQINLRHLPNQTDLAILARHLMLQKDPNSIIP